MKMFAALAFLVITLTTVSAAVKADAVSDQKKAYKAHGIDKAMGIDLNKNKPALCKLLTKADATRFLGKPVREGESAGPVLSGCAYHAADGSNDGILVSRDTPGYWPSPAQLKSYKAVAGVGDKAYTYVDVSGSNASAKSSKGVTDVLIH